MSNFSDKVKSKYIFLSGKKKTVLVLVYRIHIEDKTTIKYVTCNCLNFKLWQQCDYYVEV